ncbi:MAG: hypothetical protein HYS69_02740 [candidate division NC10 bacterium]|nr:hypothetical protein [candidate division NC10 bacterium]
MARGSRLSVRLWRIWRQPDPLGGSASGATLGADPPKLDLNLTPLYSAGLWLAVMTTAPAARSRTTA